MQKKLKYNKDGLTKKTLLSDAAKFVMDVKLFNLNSAITKYFKDESVENLHSVRIALRRVRYSIEIFTICFNRKKYHAFYKKLESLQELSGSARDLDVQTNNLKKFQLDAKIPVSKKVFERIDKEKFKLKEDLKLELLQFIHSKTLKEFQTLLHINNLNIREKK